MITLSETYRKMRSLAYRAGAACGTVLAIITIAASATYAQDNGRSEVFRPPQSLERKVEVIQGRHAAASEVIFRFRDNFLASATPQQLTSAIEELRRSEDAEEFEMLSDLGILRIRSRSKNAEALARQLARRPDVLYAEPNYVVYASAAATNDPRFGELWGLQNTGQGTMAGTPGADIKAVNAWGMTMGSTAHVVAVVDTGVDYNHPDLSANMWRAPASFTVTIAGVTITCAAGTRGYNAIKNTCDPMDDQDHGTHVAGTIGAVGNNGVGITGVSQTTRIMGLKFLDAQGSGTVANAIKALEFAVQVKNKFAATKGADIRILNNSWGGDGFSQAMLDVIRQTAQNDMLFVASAGNDTMNIDMKPTYPASYNEPNVITVAATNNRDVLAWFSNYGAKGVHLAAPGESILSTTRQNTYKSFSGTSMASPHVSGTAALVLSNCPVNTTGLKDILLRSADPLGSLSGVTITGARLNAAKAVNSCTVPYYTVSVAPGEQTIMPGTSKAYTVTVTPFKNYTGSVSLRITGLPTGVKGTFSPSTLSMAGAVKTSTLTVTAPLTAMPGIHRFTVNAVSSNQQRSGWASARIPGYTVTDLGSLPAPVGSRLIQARGVNSTGQVAGVSNTQPSGWTSIFKRAYLNTNGTMKDLGTLGGQTSEAYGLSNMGHVVGYAMTTSGYMHAFLWSNGKMVDLGTLAGHAGSYAAAVNDSGYVVGYSENGSTNERAFLRTTGAIKDLGTLGGSRSRATAINNLGQVAGYSQTLSGVEHAFVYSSGAMKDISTIGKNAKGTSRATDINEAGQVVGHSTVGQDLFTHHAFLWTNGTFKDLGALAGYPFSYAKAVNGTGQVVGYVSVDEERFAGDKKRAFLYRNNKLLNLNEALPVDTPWILLEANDINDDGVIVGTGILNGETRGFLLKPLN